MALPADIVEKFDGKMMNIVGYGELPSTYTPPHPNPGLRRLTTRLRYVPQNLTLSETFLVKKVSILLLTCASLCLWSNALPHCCVVSVPGWEQVRIARNDCSRHVVAKTLSHVFSITTTTTIICTGKEPSLSRRMCQPFRALQKTMVATRVPCTDTRL